MSKRVDLLNGGIIRSLTALALPIMATSLIQMAYSLTDMIWIGRMGSDQVAAIGAAGLYTWLLSAASVLARMGGQVKLGHSAGAKDYGEAVKYAQNAIQMGMAFSLLFGLIVVFFCGGLISFFNLNGQTVIDDAKTYLYITGGLMLFSMLNQIFTGLITSSGNSKTPFIATTIGLVLNIVLDPILIFGIGPIKGLGVAGAAIATVIAQIVVFLIFMLYIKGDHLIFAKVRFFAKPSLKHMATITKIGLPAALQSAMMSVISMVIARLVAGFGDAAVAVQKVGSQIESISWMTADGFGVAVNSFIAQNYGAKNTARAVKGYKAALVITLVWGVLATLLLVLFAGPIFNIFIPDPAVLPLGIDYLVILGFSQLFMCVEIVGMSAYSGFGRTTPPAVISIIFTFLRIPMAILLSQTALGLNGIWWSISISSILKGVIILAMFSVFLLKLKRNTANAE